MRAHRKNDGTTSDGTPPAWDGESDGDDTPGDGGNLGESGDPACAAVPPAPWPAANVDDPSVVSFDDKLFFTVDGARFFPIGFYHMPSDEDDLATYAAEGFNTGLSGIGCCSGTKLDDQIAQLERAQDAGLFVIFHPWSRAADVLDRPEVDLEAELDARTGIGSLFGWYTFDEPGLRDVDKALTGRMHEVLTTYDPTHLDGLVDAPLTDFSRYVDDCSFFMVDPYPSPWMPMSYVKATMLEALEATAGEKPIMAVPQAFSWAHLHGQTDEEYRPNAAEMRNMTWQFIIHGAKGLMYWNYDASYTIHHQPEIWASFLADVAEINELMRAILADDVTEDIQVDAARGDSFDYRATRVGETIYLFTVSTLEHSNDVTLDMSPFGNIACVVDYTTGETFRYLYPPYIRIPYGPLQVRVLQVTPSG
ncbi:MAG: hypothetical protein M5R36_17920 [Deltaproteobacteria bacterium]|nr:hypothetical protein [Deltaproteobacteria bacterium]